MPGKRRDDLRAEAIRLRQEQNLSNLKIIEALGRRVDPSTVSRWLRGFPRCVVAETLRTCSACGVAKPKTTDNFSYSKKRGRFEAWCKSCVSKKGKTHYLKNKRRYNKRSATYYKKNRTRLVAAAVDYNRRRVRELMRYVCQKKHMKTCVGCSLPHPWWRLDYDHLDATKKTRNISEMVHRCASIAAIDAEIAKCELVCANCHRDRTFGRAFVTGTIIDPLRVKQSQPFVAQLVEHPGTRPGEAVGSTPTERIIDP